MGDYNFLEARTKDIISVNKKQKRYIIESRNKNKRYLETKTEDISRNKNRRYNNDLKTKTEEII